MLLVDDFQPTCPLKESSFGSLHKVSVEIPYIHARDLLLEVYMRYL